MSRQFEYLRKDIQELYYRQRVLAAANIKIMQALKIQESQIDRMKTSILNK